MTSEPGSLVMRIPGKARPVTEALAERRDYLRQVQTNLGDRVAISALLVPKPETVYRWRVALGCGCIAEEWTRGPDDFPDAHQASDAVNDQRLPLGQRTCGRDEHNTGPQPYHRIVEWVGQRLVNHEPGPEHDPDGVIDDVTWAVLRRTEARALAHWTVRLECGHHSSGPVTAPNWKPEDGPKLTTIKRQQEMLADFEDYYVATPVADEQDGIERAHVRRMLEARWPLPQPEEACFWCPRVRQITGYQRVGWLLEPLRPSKPVRARREVLEGRLARLRADQARLEQELRQLPDD